MKLLAVLALLAVLSLPATHAQSRTNCPSLPVNSALVWERIDGPDFVFCKAMRNDGRQAFAVRISADTTFKPRRAHRAEASVIDGHDVRWYAGEDPFEPETVIREALLELDRDQLLHITIRASSDAELEQIRESAEALHFAGVRTGSK